MVGCLIFDIMFNNRSQEGPGQACEEMLHSLLDKSGAFGGSDDAGVLFLQAESSLKVNSNTFLQSLSYPVSSEIFHVSDKKRDFVWSVELTECLNLPDDGFMISMDARNTLL